MKKYALVIGNSDYENVGKLKNPINDSKDIKNSLESIGFNVVYGENLGLKEFNKKIKNFTDLVKNIDISFFYYAGHGLQYQGQNYLVPIDADINEPNEISAESLDLCFIENKFTHINSKANIFILDSCRDNPFEKQIKAYSNSRNISAQIDRGLANTQIKLNESLIAFATSPNEVALDNPDETNGIFTKSLLHHITKENLTIQEILELTGKDIVEETNNKQRPWIHNSIFKTKAILNYNKNSLAKSNNKEHLEEIKRLKEQLDIESKKQAQVIYKDKIVKIDNEEYLKEIERLKKELENQKIKKQEIKNSSKKELPSSLWEDPKTNLIWQKDISKEKYTYQEALDYGEKLNQENYEGFNDWRVPTIDELKTILTKEPYENSKSSSGITYIKKPLLDSMNIECQWFWSATTYSYYTDFARDVNFNSGNDNSNYKTNSHYVRCVRTGE